MKSSVIAVRFPFRSAVNTPPPTKRKLLSLSGVPPPRSVKAYCPLRLALLNPPFPPPPPLPPLLLFDPHPVAKRRTAIAANTIAARAAHFTLQENEVIGDS